MVWAWHQTELLDSTIFGILSILGFGSISIVRKHSCSYDSQIFEIFNEGVTGNTWCTKYNAYSPTIWNLLQH